LRPVLPNGGGLWNSSGLRFQARIKRVTRRMVKSTFYPSNSIALHSRRDRFCAVTCELFCPSARLIAPKIAPSVSAIFHPPMSAWSLLCAATNPSRSNFHHAPLRAASSRQYRPNCFCENRVTLRSVWPAPRLRGRHISITRKDFEVLLVGPAASLNPNLVFQPVDVTIVILRSMRRLPCGRGAETSGLCAHDSALGSQRAGGSFPLPA